MLISQKIFSNKKETKFPVLQYLQIIFFTGLIFYVGKILFIPLFYGLFIAIVLFPVCKYLERKGFPRSIAVTVCLLIVTILIAALLSLLILEINAFVSDLPQLQPQIVFGIQQLQQWLLEKFDMSIAAQASWVDDTLANVKNNSADFLHGTLAATFNTLFMVFMVPVYTALFLYGRSKFIHFLQAVVGERYKARLHIILKKTVHTYHSYIKGMILVYVIVGILNSIGLFALGVDHAVLFGMLTAIMTIIPYIGIIVSALLPISLAWITTGSLWIPLAIVAVFVLVQYLEANVIFPSIV